MTDDDKAFFDAFEAHKTGAALGRTYALELGLEAAKQKLAELPEGPMAEGWRGALRFEERRRLFVKEVSALLETIQGASPGYVVEFAGKSFERFHGGVRLDGRLVLIEDLPEVLNILFLTEPYFDDQKGDTTK